MEVDIYSLQLTKNIYNEKPGFVKLFQGISPYIFIQEYWDGFWMDLACFVLIQEKKVVLRLQKKGFVALGFFLQTRNTTTRYFVPNLTTVYKGCCATVGLLLPTTLTTIRTTEVTLRPLHR